MSSGHIDARPQASAPVHATSHAQALEHCTPLRHDLSPEHATVQRPAPQMMSPRQLSNPVHSTRHAPATGQITSSPHDRGPPQAITQTPPSQVPGQPAPHDASGPSGGHPSGRRASRGPSFGGLPASTRGPSCPGPGSSPPAPSPGDAAHCPACSGEVHQPSEPHAWPGAQSDAAAQRATHSPYRGS